MSRYQIARRPGAGGLDAVVLRDEQADATAELLPERGALISRFDVAGDALLYLDEATVADRSKNVRGGIPLLFPTAGKLPEGRYGWDGRSYALPQHGFARTRAWTVESAVADERSARVRCRLEADDATRAVFPFQFSAALEIVLAGGALTVAFDLHNSGDWPMPLHYGLHPYFRVPDGEKAETRVETRATRAFDNRTGNTGPLGPMDFSAEELDLHLLDHPAAGTVLHRGSERPVCLEWSEAFKTLVLWTVAGKDFLCVEPWTAPAGALATRTELIELAPGTSRRLELRIARG